ncbi:MAG TPA: nucleoside hydrolase [Chloroflexota bacterium]|nr:nucleoside hydrolase [Chloroflexota bacterium]
MKRIILDTDVGTDVDDALAIALAAASPELQLEGITTVHADAPLRARIARRLLSLAGRPDIPVIAGASEPIAMPLPEQFHWLPQLWGHEGAGLLSSEERMPTADPSSAADEAARFIVETVAARPGEVSLVAVGPLTNVARALRLEPRLGDWICDLTVMGGMVDTSRAGLPPVLETNLNADPGAAEIAFASAIPLTLVGFEVTTQVYLTPDQRAEMRGWRLPLGDALLNLMEQMLESFSSFSRRMDLPADIFQGRTYMHDPLAVYSAFGIQHVTLRRTHVALEVRDRVLRTIPRPDQSPNMRVCIEVDAPAFVDLWLSRVKSLATSAVTSSQSV